MVHVHVLELRGRLFRVTKYSGRLYLIFACIRTNRRL